MKKLRLIVAMLLVALSTMAIGTVLAACNVQFGENCDHEYEWVVKTPATCTAEGLEVQKCKKCQEEGETRKLDKIAHEYEWVETLAPTCIAKGSEHQVCKNCQAEGETREKDMVAHTPDLEKGYQIDEEAGTHAYECKVCGEPVEAEAHKKSETAKIDAEKNVHYYECTVCHARMDEGAHTYEFKTTQEATCANAGSKTEYCTVCNAEGRTETINPLDHTPDLTTVKSDETGHWNECSVCHGKVNFASHTPAGAYHYNGEEEENTHYQVCTYEGCGYHVVEDCTAGTSRINYKSDIEKGVHWQTCVRCNDGHMNETKCTLSDSWNEHSATDPDSATKTVHYKRCTTCYAEYYLGEHTITWITVKEPSCSEEGIKVGYCSTCLRPIPKENQTDNTTIEQYCRKNYSSATFTTLHSGDFYAVIEKTAHTPELTWTSDANGHYHKCSVCNQPADESIPHDATGQPWKTNAGSHWHECKDCGYEMDNAPHEYNQEDGKKCICGAEKPSDYITNIEDYTIEADGDTGNYQITAYNGDDAMIKLPTDYLEGKIVKIAANAFKSNKALTHVIIPEGYTEIGDYGFSGCTNLQEIQLPEGLTKIGTYGFSDCANLQEIQLHNGFTVINKSTFSGCTNLSEIQLPEGIREIGQLAFSSCKALTNIQLPTTLEIIWNNAFQNSGLTGTLTIPDTTAHRLTIYYSAFTGTKITTVIFSEGLTGLAAGGEANYSCFAGMSSLTTVVFPTTLASIPSQLFPQPTATGAGYTCALKALKYICLNGTKDAWAGKTLNIFEPTNKNGNSGLLSLPLYYLGDGVEEGTFKLDGDQVTVAGWTGDNNLQFYRSVAASGTTYNLLGGESWTVIGYGGEADAAVVIPDTYAGLPVAAIGKSAFNGKSLSALTFGKNITSLPASALSGLTIPAIDIPASITLEKSSLSGCKMTSVTLAVSEIPEMCFSSCSALTTIDLTGVTKIGKQAFNSCSKLKNVTWGNTLQEIGEEAFKSCGALEDVFLPTTVTTIGKQAFYYCSTLKHVIFNEGLTQLPSAGLKSATSKLEWIVFPSTLTGNNAFGGTSTSAWVFGSASAIQTAVLYFGGDEVAWDALRATTGTSFNSFFNNSFKKANKKLFFYAQTKPDDDTTMQLSWHWKDDSAKTEPEKWSDVAAASVNALPVALDLTHSGKDLFSKNLY